MISLIFCCVRIYCFYFMLYMDNSKTDLNNFFSFNVKIPLEVRKSSRLQHKIPTYTEDELDNIQENVRRVFFKRPGINVNDYIRMVGIQKLLKLDQLYDKINTKMFLY